LRSIVFDVSYFDSDLFHYLAPHGLFTGLARLYKARKTTVETSIRADACSK
jgi:hypothetical protein